MIAGTLTVDSAAGRRTVNLEDYLSPPIEEQAVASANAWIKELRTAIVDGEPMRRRFTYHGDSLWWFTELYLHKTGAVEDLFRAILGVEQLVERERPVEMALASGERILRGVAPQVAAARGVRYRGAAGFGGGRMRLARLDLRARALTMAAYGSRLKRRMPLPTAAPAIAAFVHRAFWRTDVADGSAESYIGPVLSAIEQRRLASISYVSLGPAENFSARRWWRPASDGPASLVPIEAFAPMRTLAGSRRLWRERYRLWRALEASADIRERARLRGCDCWPIVREELAGVVLLQWPWSARAMDEAAAVFDTLRPKVALTYAEAGGWGRALVLEARRRNVKTVGLQHGFIYRHWLNYLHEPDEMEPDPANAADGGFPAPTRTLLFDDYAAGHLAGAGRFPRSGLAVVGSARLDALAAAARQLSEHDLERARLSVTGRADGVFVLLVTKYRQVRAVLPALIEAARTLGVRLAIKTHPAETPGAYSAATANAGQVVVIPAGDPLAPLLRACGALVTVNSTVALDAAVLGVPALVIGLPNNLSPFVDAGIMAGAVERGAIEPQLRRILYDRVFRDQLAEARGAFLERYGMEPDGRAAERTAAAVVGLVEDAS